MSEKNEDIGNKIQQSMDFSFLKNLTYEESLELSKVRGNIVLEVKAALDQKDRDHEALIGVLVGALNGLLSIRSTTCGGDYCGKCDRCVAKKAISHPLVQEYLKKEKP